MLEDNILTVGKADRTRERIRAAALELFADRGFDLTTVGEIAMQAGVTEMTVYRHFPTKAALVIDDPYDPVIAEAIAARPSGEPPMVAVTRGILDAWRSLPEPDVAALRELMQVIAGSRTLEGALDAGSRATESAVRGALASRSVPDADAAVVAAAAVAGLNTALVEWGRGAPSRSLNAAISDALRALGGDA